MQYHEVANLFPLMVDGELADLAADIKNNGLHNAIWTYQGKIVDGRNRYKACQLAGVEPRYQEWGGGTHAELVAFVVGLNVKRRHLTPSQLAVLSLAVEAELAISARENLSAAGVVTRKEQGLPILVNPVIESIHASAEAAKIIGVSKGYVIDAKKVEREAPDLIPQIAAGTMTIPEAKREIKQRARRDAIETYEPPPLQSIANGPFDVILADPPWRYDFSVSGSREIENNYPTMTVDEICALPVPAICATDCILYLWATNPKLLEALRVIEAWGFEYKTNAVWVKDKIGMGYYFRQQHELLLVATRGTPEVPPPEVRVSSIIVGDRADHSAKPPAVYDILEKWYPHKEKAELFCRNPRPGWYTWGNQA